MLETPVMTDDQTELLTKIAVLYYQNGATQDEIARRFSISRVKVGRLLKKARDEGVVEIHVRHHPVYSASLEQRLQRTFGLKRALIALDQSSEDDQRQQVATVVSKYLSSHMRDGDVVAIGQGRNVAAVAENGCSVDNCNVRFVSAIGGTYPAGDEVNADHICRKLARRFNGSAETLYAPAYVEPPELVDIFMENPTIKQTLDRARKADIALVGIGDMNEGSHMLKLGWFTHEDLLRGRSELGLVGDVMGYEFFRLDGHCDASMMKGRIVGLHMDELRRVPCVIGMASESSKVLAIHGALKTGCIDILATSVNNALALLSLAESESR